MDHLLRNWRLGALATPVSYPFFIDHLVYFLHRRDAQNPTHLRCYEGAMVCFMPLALIGIFFLIFQTDICVQQAGHPEGKTVTNAFLLQMLAFIIIIARYSAR